MSTTNESFLSAYTSYVNSLPSFLSDSSSFNLSSLIESHYDLRTIYDENGNRIENNSNELNYNEYYKDNVDDNGDEIEEEEDPESPNFNLRRFRTSRINRLNNRITSYNRIYRYRSDSNSDNRNENVQRNNVRQADEVSLIVPRTITNRSRQLSNSSTDSFSSNSNSSTDNRNTTNTTNTFFSRNDYETLLDRSLTASPTPLTRSDHDNLTVNRYINPNSYQLSPFSSRYT